MVKNGFVVDPMNNVSQIMDLYIKDGRIVEKFDLTPDCEVINASGKIVAPGFIDLHVHFREPGFEYKETIKTGAAAAARGGFTTVCCMANTNPVVDNAGVVADIYERAKNAPVHVLQFGAATRGMEGKALADFEGMLEAGITGISEDGKTVEDAALYLEALKKANDLNLTVYSHCEEEEEIIARDIKLAEEAGAKLHICHVSTAAGVEMIKQAKERGLPVTCEVTPHHLLLSKDDIINNDTNFKMSPPLRSREDAAAMREALRDGIIDCIATDHAPHSKSDKSGGWEQAANGVTGLETAFPVCYGGLVKTGVMTIDELIRKMSCNPAVILGINKGRLSIGDVADIVIIEQDKEHIINADDFRSMGKNTPWFNYRGYGEVHMTISNGKIVYKSC